MEERIKNSETRHTKIAFSNTLNDRDTLFGGLAMKWMDEVAYITATRLTRKKMVTVSVKNIKFKTAIEAGTIIEIVGKINKINHATIDIDVEIFSEKMYTDEINSSVKASFVFAAIDDNNKPVALKL